ncbi:Ger(x)C family spore germination protein [Paenibacillus monticola]|uniref:Ger(X)C family spore germination protein n=1 Tax=Paenibacillus monticola TaxID=2666075 RepID=A0A7X2L3C9_9BACL|nr:Ger(x)C family spore germination protein [Paenibacillus monticola]MRN55148.1 Ger(x)C family spore germination protein [Paenibacillus monticola]
MRTLKLGLILLLLINLTGCWSKVELDELIFIYGLYIDSGKEPGTVEVTISAPLPNRLMSGQQSGSGSGDGKTYTTVSKTAATLPEAISSIQKDLTRQLNLAHIKVVVIGKEYAKQGISELLEWFKRDPGFPLGTFIMASPGSAKEITHLTPIFEQQPSQVLMEFAAERFMFDTTVKDCLLAEANGMGFVMNYLSFGMKSETTEQGKPEYWAGIQGAMLFQDGKMEGTLKVKKSKALSWAGGHLRFPHYSITWDDGKSTATAIFISSKSSKAVTMFKNRPVFKVQLKGRMSIIFMKDTKNRTLDKVEHLIVTKLQNIVTEDVAKAIQKTQEAGTDVLQLGMLMEWNYPKKWEKLREQWNDYYAHDADIQVTADFQIDDFGTEK